MFSILPGEHNGRILHLPNGLKNLDSTTMSPPLRLALPHLHHRRLSGGRLALLMFLLVIILLPSSWQCRPPSRPSWEVFLPLFSSRLPSAFTSLVLAPYEGTAHMPKTNTEEFQVQCVKWSYFSIYLPGSHRSTIINLFRVSFIIISIMMIIITTTSMFCSIFLILPQHNNIHLPRPNL